MCQEITKFTTHSFKYNNLKTAPKINKYIGKLLNIYSKYTP